MQDILDKALINRSTFYKHYNDKYELAEILCTEVLNLLKKGVEKRFDCTKSEDIIVVIKNLYQLLLTKKEQILALYTINTNTIHLYNDMYNFLKESFYKNYQAREQKSPAVLDYLSELYASIVMTAIRWCLQNNGYEELAKQPELFLKLAEVFDYSC